MYTRLKNVQIVISLLKKHGIKHLVLSAGQSNYPFVHSVESDPFFVCYSVVDERSAAFFALGLAQELNEPVAISCTASTACCNYLSAVTEAFYQKVPLVVLTSNRDIRRLGQLELLMIQQNDIFKGVCKKEVQLPAIRNDRDFEYCQRLVNEALLELNHRGKGPVHIDMPSYGQETTVDVPTLPNTRYIRRNTTSEKVGWSRFIDELKSNKKIMVLCGQKNSYDERELFYIEKFFNKYNCIIVSEHMGNLKLPCVINMNPIFQNTASSTFEKFAPEILITIGGHIAASWDILNHFHPKHWSVNENGDVIDPCNSLVEIFECMPIEFFKYFVDEDKDSTSNDMDYFNTWKNASESVKCPDMPLSHIFAIEKLITNLPDEGILHLSILNSIRITQYFDIPIGIKCYANLGALGIDGSMSTFFGQAAVANKPAYLIIGDLSFFYDMNSLKIRHIKSNVHILLLNNGGGGEFYQNNGINETIDLHTAARHSATAKGWALDNNFKYISADSIESYIKKLEIFINTDTPIIFEVFTDMQTDMECLKCLKTENSIMDNKDKAKSLIKNAIGEKGVNLVKRIVNRS